jgi:putative ABC transport system permease protein
VADLWFSLPLALRDGLTLLAVLAPAVLCGAFALRGYRAWPLVSALLRRHPATNLLLVGLVAASVGLGVAIVAQERALRQGSANAAGKFDLIVAAPGDQIGMLLAAVYLQPSDAPLLGGDALARLQADDRIDLLAPIAFGDSYAGVPVVGTTAPFVRHLSGDLAEGRIFETIQEAVAGALAPAQVGEVVTPVHGHGPVTGEAHDGFGIAIVGRMAPTGTPWDRAILTPVEGVWAVHGLATGHPPEEGDRVGPPFHPDHFPGTPAFIVHTEALWEAYAVQASLDGPDMMAFFPGAVLARLHGLLGDVRQAMSLMATAAQLLVAAGVMTALVALSRLFARRFALLRALGAPRRFVFGVIWSYAAVLLGAGCALGLGLGWIGARLVAAEVTARTDIAVSPGLRFEELFLVAAFFAASSLLALLPAFATWRRDAVADLRQI